MQALDSHHPLQGWGTGLKGSRKTALLQGFMDFIRSDDTVNNYFHFGIAMHVRGASFTFPKRRRAQHTERYLCIHAQLTGEKPVNDRSQPVFQPFAHKFIGSAKDQGTVIIPPHQAGGCQSGIKGSAIHFSPQVTPQAI